MSNILERLQGYTAQDPSAVILYDEAHSKGISYAQLDDMSGRVYAYLKAQNIGREDFVLIDLPRGVLPVIAMVGVWKAGAAWALVEDTYAPDRIAYIRKDCGCKLELSAENWDEVMRTEPITGYAPFDDHDAAYAIYTSGTTGNPKGVLHERGNLERAILSIRLGGEIPFNEKDRLATLAPMNFVATVIVILAGLNVFRGKNYIVSYATIKNPGALAKFFLAKRITITFLTPSYVRMLGGFSMRWNGKLIAGGSKASESQLTSLLQILIHNREHGVTRDRLEELLFEELFSARPHVFLGRRHPLAKKKAIRPEELDAYPYITYEQGVENALYFAEEVMPAIDRKKNIRVRDRATMTKLMLGLNGYTVSSGARSKMYANDIVAVPLKLDDFIRIGLVRRSGISLSTAGEIFVSNIRLKASVASNKH